MTPLDKWKPLSREPTFNPEERREAVLVLTAVRGEMFRHRNEAICAMLDQRAAARTATQLTVDTVEKLKQLIKVRLGGAATVRHWLVNQGYPAAGNTFDVRERVFSVRYRWVDALRKEMEDEQASGGGNVPHKKRRARDTRAKRR